MIKSLMQKLVIFTMLICIAGCAENKYVKTVDRLCPANATKTSAMTAGENVLEDMHFTIEKFDDEAGIIRTAPLSGAQSFELWRSDSVSSFNRTEADVQSVRRIVEVNVIEQNNQICINCKATTQRLSMPQGISTDEQGYGTIIKSRSSFANLQPTSKQKADISWINLGRDSQLETEIISRIETRLQADKNQLNIKKEPSK
jgi:hypothetical protein